jgi:hypothetical protein
VAIRVAELDALDVAIRANVGWHEEHANGIVRLAVPVIHGAESVDLPIDRSAALAQLQYLNRRSVGIDDVGYHRLP